MNAERIPVTIVGGYLGSGKTTLVNHLLQTTHNHRFAVLVNDFGKISIDEKLIETQRDNIISLTGGCVCCSYGNDLISALREVIVFQPSPQHIVIEASGVALPAAIAASVSLLPELYCQGILVLADVETVMNYAADRYLADTISHQLASADIIILNKTDLINSSQEKQLVSWIRKRWPSTPCIFTSYGRVGSSLILEQPVNNDNFDQSDHLILGSVDQALETSLSEIKKAHEELFKTLTITFKSSVDAQALAISLASNKANLVRAKGFVRGKDGFCQLIQVVGKRHHVEKITEPTIELAVGSVVCIGLANTFNEPALIELVNNLGEMSLS